MLRRLTLGLFVLASAAAVAACSSNNTNVPSTGGVPGVGPNFVTNTIYVANTTQNVVDIYTPSPGPSATPQFGIGGSSTGLNGPQYLAFNSSKQLWVTNFNSGTKAGTIEAFQMFATGNVLPLLQLGVSQLLPVTGGQPRGIAFFPKTTTNAALTVTSPGQFFTSELAIFDASTSSLVNNIAGSNTGLSSPSGVAIDSKEQVYVANSGNASVTVYALPSPTVAPSTSPSPSPSPSPSVSPSTSPSPTPTPSSDNIAPVTTIAGASTTLVTPTGLAFDAKGNLYVADAGNVQAGQAPKILVFNAPLGAGVQNIAPSATITSSAFIDPTDVKVDSSGTIYVMDFGNGPNTSKLLIFAPNTTGAATPAVSLLLPQGNGMGLALSP